MDSPAAVVIAAAAAPGVVVVAVTEIAVVVDSVAVNYFDAPTGWTVVVMMIVV